MNIDFVPSPLASSPESVNGFCFEMKPLLSQPNYLFEAVANGQVDDIRSYLSTTKNKADILDQNGESALHHAAKMNRIGVIDFMVKAGATVDMFSNEGFSPLHIAAKFNSLEALDALLKVGSWPNTAAKYSGCTALHLAARFGHKEIIHRLLNEKGLDTEVTDQQEMTALHIAISRGYRKICQELLDNGASVTITTSKGRTSLHLAAASGSTDIVALVIKSARKKFVSYPGNAIQSSKDVPELIQFINQRDACQNSALHVAVERGPSSMCLTLLQHGADVNLENKCLHTPLYVATIQKNREILELLVQRGGNTDHTDYKQKTPLHSAAAFGNPACVELLLRNSAARDPKDINGMTPFLYAVAAGQTKCVEVLLDCGADIAARDNFQRSCIHLAVENKREDVLKILLERSESGLINVPDMHERSALHYAVSSSKIRLLNILLEKKANCMLRDAAGKTPLDIAAETGMARHVEALAKASLASLGQRDADNRTPMHFAALNGKGQVCSILVQMGADVNATDSYGWTPLLFAAKNGSAVVLRNLLEMNANIDHEDQSGNTALLISSARGLVEAVQLLLNRRASLKPAADGLNCLDVAIENQQADVVMTIITNPRWKEVLSAKSPDGENRMGKLIRCFPDAAKLVMDRCIHWSVTQRSITYDFRLLDPGPDDQSGTDHKPFFGPMEMVKGKQKDLLCHDLCRKLFKIKWRTYGWGVYWTNLGLFSFFLFLMTYFMLTQRQGIKFQKTIGDPDDIFEKKNAFNELIPILILIFASFHLIKELYQIATQRMAYFKHLTNLLEWALYLFTLIFMLPYVFTGLTSLRGDPNVTWQMGTVAVFLGYMNLILFMQTLDYVGIYVTMFFQVALTVLKSISLFALFAVAFSVVFYILFKEQDAFDTYAMSLMKVIVMTTGELDYSTMLVESLDATNSANDAPLLPYRESSYLFVALFIFAMTIILTNLLVGLAVGDIETVQKNAFLRYKGKVVDFVTGIERKFPKWITRRLYRPELTVTGRKVEKKITSQKFTFKDKDLMDEDSQRSVQEDDEKLDILTKELVKAKQRQTSIIETMQDHRSILLAVAARVGVDTGGYGNDQARRDVSL